MGKRSLALMITGASLVTALTVAGQPADAAAATHRIAGIAEVWPGHTDGHVYGASVELYRLAADGTRTLVDTDYDIGIFEFDVPDGTYLIHTKALQQPGPAGEAEWYQDSATPGGARPIVVAGADVVTEDILLDRPRVVTGTVTDPAGHPVQGVRTIAYRTGSGTDTPEQNYTGESVTDAAGHFRIGTGRGSFRIQITDGVATRYADQWWPAAQDYATASTVTVHGDTDIGTVMVSTGAAISGMVTSPAGDPLPQVAVTSRDGRDHFETTYTDPAGHYRLTTLGPGPQTVSYGLSPFREGTRTLTLTAGQQVDDVDVVLWPWPSAPPPADGEVSGRVVDSAGHPVPHVGVEAYGTGAGSCDPASFDVLDTFTDADGYFYLPDLGQRHGLPAGSEYRLRFSMYENDQVPEYATLWYGGSFCDTAAHLVSPVLPIDLGEITLRRAGGISGAVLDETGNAPRASVEAVDAEGHVAENALVQRDGSYVLNALDAGDYQLHVRGYTTDGNPVSIGWWPAAPDRAGAVPVHVANGQVTGSVDYAYRAKERPVTGRLLDPDGGPAANVWVIATGVGAAYGTGAPTGEDGTFTLRLFPGTYRVEYGDANVERSRYQHRWYPSTPDQAAATPVVVAAGGAVDLGVITAAPYPSISGTVTDRQGHPLVVEVSLRAPDGEGACCYFTDSHPDGSYRLYAPVPDSYTVGFFNDDWFDAAYAWAAVGPVDVGPEAQVTGVDVVMGPAPTAPPGSAPPPTHAGTPLTSTTRAVVTYRDVRGHGAAKLVLKVRVTALGSDSPPDGTVTITEHGRTVVGARALSHGRLRVALRQPRGGRHTYLVTYSGSPLVAASSTRVPVEAR